MATWLARVIFLFLIFATVIGTVRPAQGAVYDLSENSTIVVPTDYGPAIFTTDFTLKSGTGTYDPFLTIQNRGTEEGYNTSAGVFDTKREPQWNHELQVRDLEQSRITIDGAEFYSFTLDINEANGGGAAPISLDSLKLFLSPTPGQTTENVESLGTKVFDLDGSHGDNTITYVDDRSGSGRADIAFFIPVTAFAGAGPGTYVYMYQAFGGLPGFSSDGGFEETRLGKGISFVKPVPEPAAALPLMFALTLAFSRRHLSRPNGSKHSDRKS